jgi:hypothetical protein
MSDTPPHPAELSPSAPAHAQQPSIPIQPSESWENPKEQAPMLDVHPAHHAANTWRDFFIHIATIVLGLLIAVGLEQTVEYVHHRSQAREARESIQQELLRANRTLQRNIDALASNQQQLEKNLQLLESGAADAQVLPYLIYQQGLTRARDTAWNSAKIDGSIALIPADETGIVNYIYETLGNEDPVVIAYLTDLETASALVDHARATGKLSAPVRQQLLSLTVSELGRARILSKLFSYQVDAITKAKLTP